MTYREAFDQFWALYPKQLFINEAQTAFAAAIKSGVRFEDIIAGVERYRVQAHQGRHRVRLLQDREDVVGEGLLGR